jgi:hypothetical protein
MRYALLSSVRIEGVSAQAVNARLEQASFLNSFAESVNSSCGNVITRPLLETLDAASIALTKDATFAVLILPTATREKTSYVLQGTQVATQTFDLLRVVGQILASCLVPLTPLVNVKKNSKTNSDAMSELISTAAVRLELNFVRFNLKLHGLAEASSQPNAFEAILRMLTVSRDSILEVAHAAHRSSFHRSDKYIFQLHVSHIPNENDPTCRPIDLLLAAPLAIIDKWTMLRQALLDAGHLVP